MTSAICAAKASAVLFLEWRKINSPDVAVGQLNRPGGWFAKNQPDVYQSVVKEAASILDVNRRESPWGIGRDDVE